MSVIHEALKKTEGTIHTPQDAASPDGPSPEVTTYLKKKGATNRIKWAIFFLLAIGIGIYIGNSTFDILGKSKALLKTFSSAWPFGRKNAEKGPSTPSRGIPLLPGPKKGTDSLALNGVFFSGKEGYALINNQIVKVGDSVSGATVRSIKEDEVALDLRGEIIKLSTR
jgi:hypothetical protein